MLVLSLDFVVCFKANLIHVTNRRPSQSAPAGAALYGFVGLPAPIRTVKLMAFQTLIFMKFYLKI